MLRQQQTVASYCIASWESFLSKLWYFYEIAAAIRAETSLFHIFRLLHNTILSFIYLFCLIYYLHMEIPCTRSHTCVLKILKILPYPCFYHQMFRQMENNYFPLKEALQQVNNIYLKTIIFVRKDIHLFMVTIPIIMNYL